MKGLLIKDILNLRQQGRTMLMLLGFYVVYSYVLKNTSMIVMITSLYAGVLPVTAMSYDSQCGFDRLALSMPVRRRDIVLEKYLLFLVLAVAGVAVSTVACLVLSLVGIGAPSELVSMTGGSLLMGFYLVSLSLPLIYRFGVERARMMMLAVMALPALLVFLFLGKSDSIAGLIGLVAVAAIPVGLLILAVSAAVSCAIFEKKEV